MKNKSYHFFLGICLVWGMPCQAAPNDLSLFVQKHTQRIEQTTSSNTKEPDYTPLLVFVSFSMPKASLQQWITQTRLAGGSVVIRGLVENSFKKTAEVLSPLLEKEPNGVLVDPTLFQKFQIQQVPAVVVQTVSGDTPEFDVLYGDVSLAYALEQLSKTQTAQAPVAEKALQKLKGKPHA